MFSYNTRFLIVDDFVTIRKVIRKTLKEMGYTNVQEAEDGQQALSLLQSSHSPAEEIQFIITDIHMPKVPGPELWTFCQKSPTAKNIPFLFVTTGDDHPEYLESLRSDYSNYIVKPFTQKNFKAKLEHIWTSISKSKNLKVS